MAVVKIPETSRLVLTLDDGLDNEGNPQTKTKSFNNVKPDATDEPLYNIANSVAQLQSRPLITVERNDYAELADDGQ